MSRKAFFFLVFLACSFCLLARADLKRGLTIGSDDPDHPLFSISGAVFDKKMDLYVADGKGGCIRKYDAAGRLTAETGRSGQGPGEFSEMLSGICWDGEVHVLDAGNGRISVFGPDLKMKRQVPVGRPAAGLARLGDRYYTTASGGDDPFRKMFIVDEKGDFGAPFFDRRPAHLDRKPADKMGAAFQKIYSALVFTADREARELVVSFQWPGKKMVFFVYSPEGKFLRSFELEHQFPYEFPEYRLSWPVKYPVESRLVSVMSIHSMSRNRVLVEYWVQTLAGNKVGSTNESLLVVDTVAGKIVRREPVEGMIRVTDFRNGRVCAWTEETDSISVASYELRGR